jgi:phosphotransferase system HPr (HPr) family protein
MEKELTILNKLGLHARPAAEFVRCARRFKSTVLIKKDGVEYSAASILDVLSANLECGARMSLSADGPDAGQALDELEALIRQFQEQEDD